MEKLPTISVCTIVKNEAMRMDSYLSSLSGFADEIIIVDTGSTDGTIVSIEDYLSSHPAANIRLLKPDRTEGFHYGMAKNFSLSQATKDYTIVLDADERLSDEFKSSIRQFLSLEAPLVAKVIRKDKLLPHLIDYPERIIKRGSGIRYGEGPNYRVHEQLEHTAAAASFSEPIWHDQAWNHYVIRPQRILFQLELQIDRVPRTKSFIGHVLRGAWYFCHRFNKIYFTRKLYKDGALGFKYAFIRAIDAFLVEFFVGLKPTREKQIL